METITTTATEAEVNDALEGLALLDWSEATDEEIAEAVDEALSACGDIKAKMVAAGIWDWIITKIVGWLKGIWGKLHDWWTETIVDRFLQQNKIFTFTPPSGNGPG